MLWRTGGLGLPLKGICSVDQGPLGSFESKKSFEATSTLSLLRLFHASAGTPLTFAELRRLLAQGLTLADGAGQGSDFLSFFLQIQKKISFFIHRLSIQGDGGA